ncbi:hypothetical protein ES703_53207 [subsurface metagenome]
MPKISAISSGGGDFSLPVKATRKGQSSFPLFSVFNNIFLASPIFDLDNISFNLFKDSLISFLLISFHFNKLALYCGSLKKNSTMSPISGIFFILSCSNLIIFSNLDLLKFDLGKKGRHNLVNSPIGIFLM